MQIKKRTLKNAKKADVYYNFLKKMAIFFFLVWLSSFGDQSAFRNIISIYIAFSSYLLVKKMFVFKQQIENEVQINRVFFTFIKKIFVFLFYSILLYIVPAGIFTLLYPYEIWLTGNILLIQFGATWLVVLLIFFVVWAIYQVKNLLNINVKALLKFLAMKFFVVFSFIEKIKTLILFLIAKTVKKIKVESKVLYLFENTQRLKIHKKSIEVIGF